MKRSAHNLRALARLGPARAVAFLRAVRAEGDCLAVRFLNEALDRAETLADLLGDEMSGYYLDAKALAPLRFEVGFGCMPGPMVGDGGTWTVTYDEEGKVVEVEGGELIMS